MMWKNILIAFLAVNAIFWGLFSHSAHCAVASLVTKYCLPHTVHVSIGIVCFAIAVLVAHPKMFFK